MYRRSVQRLLISGIITAGVLSASLSSLTATPAAAQKSGTVQRSGGQTVGTQRTAPTLPPTVPQTYTGTVPTTHMSWPFPVPQCDYVGCRPYRMYCTDYGGCTEPMV